MNDNNVEKKNIVNVANHKRNENDNGCERDRVNSMRHIKTIIKITIAISKKK